MKLYLYVSFFSFIISPLFCIDLSAQLKFSFSGYAVELPVFQSYDSRIAEDFGTQRNQFLNLTRVRIRTSADLWENSRLEAEYEIDALYFGSSGNLELNTAEKTNRQLFDLRWNPVNKKHFSLVHFIDRLYFRQEFKSLSVVLGRQRISWGTGRIWNPTDLFNPINPASYYKIEKDGADAVSAKYSFGSFTDLNVVFNPQEKIKNSNYGFRFRTNYAEYDMSVMGGYFDNRIVGGLDFAGNLFTAGVRGEGIISVKKDSTKDRFVKFILGIDNQFTPELYALAEYHFNGEGKSDRSEYNLQRLFRGEIQNLSKNYFCISVFYLFNPLLNLTLTGITNLNDGSGFVNAVGSFSVTENIYINLGAQAAYGSYKSEYKYYPFSLYLQGEYYF
jgi:hypothetical protein